MAQEIRELGLPADRAFLAGQRGEEDVVFAGILEERRERALLVEEVAAPNFAIAFLLSFVFMYMSLASQFESFLHPITMPLTTALTADLTTALGAVLVSVGVTRGHPRAQAILEANHARLRPSS